jgi:hypothetical protein
MGNPRDRDRAVRRLTFIAGLALALADSAAFAAPLPPFAPVNICGEIAAHSWSEMIEMPGQPGFSGSLDHDRVFPARFSVELISYTGVRAETVALINGLLSFPNPTGDRLLLLLDSTNPHLLDGAATLCVSGYTIHGDEGGTWTDYDTLTVR